MSSDDDDNDGLDELAKKTAQSINEQLSDVEAAVLRKSASKLQQLKVNTSDKQAFDKLVAVVNQATQQNEDVAAFGSRVEALGSEVLSVAKKIVKLI